MLLLARERVMAHERRIQAAGKRYKRVVLLQPDLVFDSRGNAVLVECNMNGYMVGDAHKVFFSLQAESRAPRRQPGDRAVCGDSLETQPAALMCIITLLLTRGGVAASHRTKA